MRSGVGLGVALVVLSAVLAVSPGSAANLSVASGSLAVSSRTYGSPVTCTLTAAADSHVARELGGANFGTATTLEISSDGVATRRSFVRFDLTSCSPAIPADALVQSATVRLTVAAVAAATRTYELRSVSSGWVETSITWSNQPPVSSTVTGTATVAVGALPGTVAALTAIADVQNFVTGSATNAGWRIADSSEGGLGTPLVFRSREALSGTPELTITYLP